MVDPIQRPTRGEDMLMLQRKLGFSTRDMMWILGLNPTSYRTSISGAGGRQPLQMPVALVIRTLSVHPELSLLPVEPSATDFFELCIEIDPAFSAAKLATLLGRSETSAYRWLKSTKVTMTKGARRWMLVMWLALKNAHARTARKQLLDGFFEVVLDEAEARGYDRSVLQLAHKWRLTSAPSKRKPPGAIGASEGADRMISVPEKRTKARKASKKRAVVKKKTKAPTKKRK
ncbi:MAG: hypothetical protein ABIW82_17085 [Dokdonella sp.]